MKQIPLWKRRKWSINRMLALVAASKKQTTLENIQKRFGLNARDLMAMQWRLHSASDDGRPLLGVRSSTTHQGPTVKAAVSNDLLQMAGLNLSETFWAVRALNSAYGGPLFDKALKGIAAEMTQGKWKENFENLERFYPDPSPAVLLPEGCRIIDAIQHSRYLIFHYKGGELVKRIVKPVSFRQDHRRWRLLAWDIQREGWRVFRLDQMKRTKLGEKWAPWLSEKELKDFKNMDLSVFRPTGQEVQVKIKIRQPAYDRFKHLFPHTSVPTKGWVTLTLPSNSPEWVARHFLPALGDVQVQAPAEFRDCWLKEIKAVQAIYA